MSKCTKVLILVLMSLDTHVHVLYFLDVIQASKELHRSNRIKRVLEIILAFGNYMNRGNRGNASGFKIQSLNKMVDTKSSIDKKVTLIHHLASVVKVKVST